MNDESFDASDRSVFWQRELECERARARGRVDAMKQGYGHKLSKKAAERGRLLLLNGNSCTVSKVLLASHGFAPVSFSLKLYMCYCREEARRVLVKKLKHC